MKVDEKIFLKYLSDMLTQTEREEFENLLIENHIARKQFDELKNKLNSLKHEPEVDERYFNALLPKTKLRLKKPGKKYLRQIAYVIPVLIFIFYFGFFYKNNSVSTENKNEVNFLMYADNKELVDEIFSDFYLDETISIADDSLAIVAQEDIQQNLLQNGYDYFIDDNGLDNFVADYLPYLTEEEINELYKKLNGTNNL